jgi:hypothetical protein
MSDIDYRVDKNGLLNKTKDELIKICKENNIKGIVEKRRIIYTRQKSLVVHSQLYVSPGKL